MYDSNTDNAHWWTKKRDVHEEVWSVFKRVEADGQGRVSDIKIWRDLYLANWGGETREDKGVVSFNGIRSVVDTAGAKISKQKPRLQIVTEGANYELREQADLLNQYLDGQLEEMDVHRKAQLVFRDACVADGGILWIYRDANGDKKRDKIKCERVYPHELFVDALESYYGSPRQMFLKRAVHREVLAALYPKKRGWIRSLGPSSLDGMRGVKKSKALVDVVESWHLPSADGADDGRHVICVENCTLFDEPWTRDDFPFVFYHWDDPLEGFWSKGLVPRLWGLQAELNTHMENVRECHRLMGHPAVWVGEGSNVGDDADVTSLIGGILRGEKKPEAIQFPVMAAPVYSWIETLREMIYNEPGASQASAEGKKPRGDLSGVAMMHVDDIETERWILQGQRYARFYKQIGEKILRESRDAFKDGCDFTIKARDKDFLRKIKWSDVDMDDDSFTLTIFDTSNIPQRPEGKIQTAMEMTKAGLMSPEVATEMVVGIPDIKAAVSVERAPRENILRMLDLMLKKNGEQLSPLPYMNLELARTLTVNKLNQCDVDGVPEERKQRLLNFLAQIQDMLDAQTPPAPMQPDPGMMPPPPMGAPPPMGPPPGDPMMDPMMGGEMPPEMMMPPPDGLAA